MKIRIYQPAADQPDDNTTRPSRDYPVVFIDQASLAMLIALKRETGITVNDARLLEEALGKQDGKQIRDLDDDGLLALGLLVWLARRCAGDTCTLEEATAFSFDDFEFIAEPGDPDKVEGDDKTTGQESDPTQAASDQAAPDGADEPKTSTTSKRRSTRG